MARAYTFRDVSLSVEYRLWQILLQTGWTHQVQGIELEPITGDGVPANTYGIPGSLPWVFMDTDGRNSRDGVKVYDDGAEVDNTTLMIDWLNARITFPAPPAGPVTADVHYYLVRLREGYPTAHELDYVELPIVAHTIEDSRSRPFAIGTSMRWYRWSVTIDILARNDAQRKDLQDDIAYHVIRMPLLRMSETQYLGNNGDHNPEFDFDTQFVNTMHIPAGMPPAARALPPKAGASQKEEFRSIISVFFEENR